MVWREAEINMHKIKPTVRNDDDFEVLPVYGGMKSHLRKFVVIACYLPPNYCRKKGLAAMEYITEVKRKYKDPYLFVAGNFNQWEIEQPLQDFADVGEVDVGNTRGDRCIDRIFTNLRRSVLEAGTLAPLETEVGEDEDREAARKSDHRIAYCKLNVPKLQSFVWESYSYRYFSKEAEEAFKSWIVNHRWDEVVSESTSNGMAEAYQRTVN